MDTFDRKILQILQSDSRTSLQDIGQAVGLSPSPCWGRIKKMEEAGVIKGYTVRLNAESLGLGESAMVQLTLDSHSSNTLEKFGETLAAIPEVIEARLVSGEYDYLLRVAVKDTKDYERLCANACTRSRDTPQQIKLRFAHPEKIGSAAAALSQGGISGTRSCTLQAQRLQGHRWFWDR
jgi:Lrp/AsnC family leucine-responsive transcriptional regulator